MATVAVAAPARTWLDRVVGAIPLLTVFFWLYLIYAWQSWGHLTPWLFTDELESTQLARSIAETGHEARRGMPHPFDSLLMYLLAPAWWIDDVSMAYSAAKYVTIAAMTSAVFPTYWLARMLVSSRPALFAAAGATAIPAFLYAAMFVEEPLAYPVSALCLFLIVKALASGSYGWIVLAAVAAAIAPFVRDELVVIPATFAIATLFLLWFSERAKAWRTTWSRGDWVGAFTLIVGAVIVLNAVISHHAFSWYVATVFFKGRMIDYGLWAAGALTIGLGVLPVVAGLAALWRGRRVERSPEERAFVAVAVAAVIGFGWYTAIKASYISTVFSTLVVERNLIYLAPVLFVGTALFLERRRLHPLAIAAAAGLALYLVLTTPYKLEHYPYSDAPGLTILQALNREAGLTPKELEWLLLALVAASVAVCLAPRVLARRTAVTGAVLGTAAVFVVAWNLAGQIAAADASNDFSNQLRSNFPDPPNWVDRATGGERALFLGQRITDPNGVWLLEFWNRSIGHVWSLDGTAPGPGPTVTPDVLSADGQLSSPRPRVDWVVADEGINLVGKVAATARHSAGGAEKVWRLFRIEPPLRLRNAATGIYADGWTGRDSAYSQFSTPGDRRGYAVVTISRAAWGGRDVPGEVRIRVGKLRLDKQKQPAMGEVLHTVRWTVNAGAQRVFHIPAPAPPFRVDVRISPTFVPAELDPNSTDVREFGAQVAFGFATKLPAAER